MMARQTSGRQVKLGGCHAVEKAQPRVAGCHDILWMAEILHPLGCMNPY